MSDLYGAYPPSMATTALYTAACTYAPYTKAAGGGWPPIATTVRIVIWFQALITSRPGEAACTGAAGLAKLTASTAININTTMKYFEILFMVYLLALYLATRASFQRLCN